MHAISRAPLPSWHQAWTISGGLGSIQEGLSLQSNEFTQPVTTDRLRTCYTVSLSHLSSGSFTHLLTAGVVFIPVPPPQTVHHCMHRSIVADQAAPRREATLVDCERVVLWLGWGIGFSLGMHIFLGFMHCSVIFVQYLLLFYEKITCKSSKHHCVWARLPVDRKNGRTEFRNHMTAPSGHSGFIPHQKY